jgi:gas vesicle protein
MKSGKLITGVAVGAVVALILIPKTRKMLSDAVCSITDSFKDLLNKTSDMVLEEKDELNTMSSKANDFAGLGTT